MTLEEFIEQDIYCREHNIPTGAGCDSCPAKDKLHCADALRNLAGKLINSLGTPAFEAISREMERHYNIPPYNQLAVFAGYLEFPR